MKTLLRAWKKLNFMTYRFEVKGMVPYNWILTDFENLSNWHWLKLNSWIGLTLLENSMLSRKACWWLLAAFQEDDVMYSSSLPFLILWKNGFILVRCSNNIAWNFKDDIVRFFSQTLQLSWYELTNFCKIFPWLDVLFVIMWLF